MAKPVLTISSKNYGAWALRGWLMCKLAGLDFSEKVISPDDPAMKAEMLLLSSSMLVPSLQHGTVKVWDTLAIGEESSSISAFMAGSSGGMIFSLKSSPASLHISQPRSDHAP